MDEKLPAGVTKDDIRWFQKIIARCWIVTGLLVELPLEELDKALANAEASGPKYFPEIWRERAKAIMEDREMVRALAAARRDVMTTSPSLPALGTFVSDQATALQEIIYPAFREIFARGELGNVGPAVILTALVRFIADRAPAVAESLNQKG